MKKTSFIKQNQVFPRENRLNRGQDELAGRSPRIALRPKSNYASHVNELSDPEKGSSLHLPLSRPLYHKPPRRRWTMEGISEARHRAKETFGESKTASQHRRLVIVISIVAFIFFTMVILNAIVAYRAVKVSRVWKKHNLGLWWRRIRSTFQKINSVKQAAERRIIIPVSNFGRRAKHLFVNNREVI